MFSVQVRRSLYMHVGGCYYTYEKLYEDVFYTYGDVSIHMRVFLCI